MQTIASLSLTPDSTATTKALDWIRALASKHGWPEETTFRLSLCMDEALSNVIMHGYLPEATEGAITLAALEDTDSLALDIIDDGKAFDPTSQLSPPLATAMRDTDIGGHGLRLMHHFLRDMQYSRANGHNRLRLILARDARGGDCT